MTEVTLTRWELPSPPTAHSIELLLRAQGLIPSRWSNGPGDRYGVHSHTYHKVLYCASGSIVFDVGGSGFRLGPGDRLDVPPGTPHSAEVGAGGVVCIEAPAYPPSTGGRPT